MSLPEGAPILTIPDAKKLVNSGESKAKDAPTHAIQCIRDRMESAAIFFVMQETDVNGALQAISQSEKLQMRLVDNSNEDSPTLIGAISLNSEELTSDEQRILALSQQLAREFVQRFKNAISKNPDRNRQIEIINLMLDIATETNYLMTFFVQQAIFGKDIDIAEVEKTTRQRFSEWSDQMAEFET